MMVCNNPNGCDCPNHTFCKWWSPPKKAKKQGFPKSKSPSLRKTRISPVSSTAKEVKLLYSKLRKIFLTKNPKCWVQEKGCTKEATQVHHKAGRGRNTNKVDTFIATCHSCHTWIHAHPAEAREKGWLK
jgi:hypothetical protein